jgi:xylulokinase
MNRAILEGVAFAGARHLRIMEQASGQKIERVIASGGGAKAELWLRIKSSVLGVPFVVPEEQECGILGCAVMGAVATGQFSRLEDAVGAFVRHADEIAPDPAWQERYGRMQPIFDKIYFNSQSLYDDLDALANASPPAQ